jgi:uncharacterized protein involved in response to NO
MEDLGYGTDIAFVSYRAKLRGTGRPLNVSNHLRHATQILNSTVVPRPIAFVSTLSPENIPNLAPFRYGNRLVRLVFRSESYCDLLMYLASFFQVVSMKRWRLGF